MFRALLFCLSLLPISLLAQTSNAAVKSSTPPALAKRLLRLGLISKIDQQPALDHRWVRGALVPWQARKPVFAAGLDWQPFRKVQGLLLTVEIGVQQDQLQFTSDQMRELHSGMNILGYQETIDYRRWQLALGIRFDCFPNYPISPFISTKLLRAHPTHFSYQYESSDPNNVGGPLEMMAKNGVQPSPGWEYSAGLRVILAGRLHFSMAYYQMALEQKMTWSWVPYRNFGHTLFIFKNRGISVSLQYEL